MFFPRVQSRRRLVFRSRFTSRFPYLFASLNPSYPRVRVGIELASVRCPPSTNQLLCSAVFALGGPYQTIPPSVLVTDRDPLLLRPSLIRRNKLILKSENGLFITSAGVFDPGEGEIRARLYIIPASLLAIRIQRRLPFFSGEKFDFFFIRRRVHRISFERHVSGNIAFFRMKPRYVSETVFSTFFNFILPS